MKVNEQDVLTVAEPTVVPDIAQDPALTTTPLVQRVLIILGVIAFLHFARVVVLSVVPASVASLSAVSEPVTSE